MMSKKKVKVDNIIFDSKLESEHYKLFKSDVDVEIIELQKTFMLFDTYEYFDIKDNFPNKKCA